MKVNTFLVLRADNCKNKNYYKLMYFIGYNKVSCQGKYVFGANPIVIILTFLLINIPCIVFEVMTVKVSILACDNLHTVLLATQHLLETCHP